MHIVAETLLYCVYIYGLLIAAILIKPSPVLFVLVGIYAYIFFILIYRFGKCKNFDNFKYVIFLFYSAGCMAAYYITHNFYYKFKRYRFLLLLGPLVFLSAIKFFEVSLQCERGSNIRYVFYFTRKCLECFLTLFGKKLEEIKLINPIFELFELK